MWPAVLAASSALRSAWDTGRSAVRGPNRAQRLRRRSVGSGSSTPSTSDPLCFLSAALFVPTSRECHGHNHVVLESLQPSKVLLRQDVRKRFEVLSSAYRGRGQRRGVRLTIRIPSNTAQPPSWSGIEPGSTVDL